MPTIAVGASTGARYPGSRPLVLTNLFRVTTSTPFSQEHQFPFSLYVNPSAGQSCQCFVEAREEGNHVILLQPRVFR
jgi:hypothetical protein